jgi:phosphoribosylformylglycinamidine synthase
MAEGAGLGVALDAESTAALFGEDQARYLVACSADQAKALRAEGLKAGVPVAAVGRFGGTEIRLGRAAAPLADLSALYRSAFAAALSV